MANYYGYTRSNYFVVKDEEEFRQIIDSCSVSEDDLSIFEHEQNGQKYFGFGSYGSISGFPGGENEDDCEYDLNAFHHALQQVVADGHAVIITEIGWEKLRYLVGDCTIITPNEIRYFNLRDTALAVAREMLSDPVYSPRMEY